MSSSLSSDPGVSTGESGLFAEIEVSMLDIGCVDVEYPDEGPS